MRNLTVGSYAHIRIASDDIGFLLIRLRPTDSQVGVVLPEVARRSEIRLIRVGSREIIANRPAHAPLVSLAVAIIVEAVASLDGVVGIIGADGAGFIRGANDRSVETPVRVGAITWRAEHGQCPSVT